MTDTANSGPVLAADGRPLKASLNRALRRQKLRAMLLIAPLLIFIMITFVVPIGQMLFRSVENQIVSEVLPRTTQMLVEWDASSGEAPDNTFFAALTKDLMVAVEKKQHTRLGSRLNYETTGVSSLFRKSGRKVDDMGEGYTDQFVAFDPTWADPAFWADFMEAPSASQALPHTTDAYNAFASTIMSEDDQDPRAEQPWHTVYLSLHQDLTADPAADFSGLPAEIAAAQAVAGGFAMDDLAAAYIDIDEDWGTVETWQTIQTYSSKFTNGYFLNAVDMQKSPDGAEWRPEDQQIYLTLFVRTMIMSMTITISCILLGYPVAWLLANLPMRQANLLMILVLLPFWTSLLVRTSAWKVLLQQQGVINDIVVWLGLVADDNRLALINNATGTIIAMTHILLPFMILPLYSVMKTIPPTYLRAAKSLGATNWTAFWRVYFPQSVPGIGAGSILVFILSIGYYITPEIVGGTKGVFISNRIAYHISSSLNWGLAAALGAILLAMVLLLYWAYDRIVGIDNVKLGG
jgi:putative spermidine/putrescine transport system permease protein